MINRDKIGSRALRLGYLCTFVFLQMMKKIVLAGLFIFIFLFGTTKIEDYDLWWHLKTGEYIVTNQEIPTKGIFSFTAENKPWVAQGWLSTVIFYLIFSKLGPSGLIIFKALVIALSFSLLLRFMLKKKINLYLSVFILIFAVAIARIRFTERPLIFEFLFVVLFLDILSRALRPGYFELKKDRLLLLPVLMFFWANLHGSFLLGYIILGIYVFGAIIKKSIPKEKMGYFILILFLTVGASFLNPHGYHLHLWMSRLFYRTSLLPFLNEEVMPPTFSDYRLFWLFLILTGVSFISRIRKIELTDFLQDLLLFLSFSFLSVKAVRYIGLFALVSAPILGGNLDLPLRQVKEKMVKKIPFAEKSFVPVISQGGLLLLMVCVFISTFRVEKAFKFGLGVQKSFYPDKAIEFIRKNQISGNMYNSGEFGGYLAWKCYPERPIFFFNDPVLFEDLIDSIYQSPLRSEASKPSNFAGLFEKFNINYILKSYSTLPLESYYLSKGDWKLVYWDESALVYLRDTPENRPIISKYSYQYIDPLNFNPSFAQVLVKHNFAQFVLEGLERNIKENPDNFKAHLFLGYLYENLGKNEEAVNCYLTVKKIKPKGSYIHYQIGLHLGKLYLEKNPHLAIKELTLQRKYLPESPELEFYLGTAYYLLGNPKMAIKKFNCSLELNPHQAVVLSNLGFLYYDLARYQEAIKAHGKAVEIDSNFADSYYGLALIYEKLVEKEEAIKNWEKYLTLSKDPRWIATAKEHLEKLRTQRKQ